MQQLDIDEQDNQLSFGLACCAYAAFQHPGNKVDLERAVTEVRYLCCSSKIRQGKSSGSGH